ncbi:hypothetical protein [Pseudoxanthomonas mexicana]|uniref:hypothetical protein n=1 Tax=Pseudoxanthomonas mexicana TaxID=128785 RepID=UPI00398B40F1
MIANSAHFRPVPPFLLIAALMLTATLLLHIPLMLWDHIDLVPIHEAWQRGDLAGSEFWRIHDGSHFHSAAYAVLLLTTWLSGGQPWLDCMVSWAVLVVQAWLLLGIARSGWQGMQVGRAWWLVLLLMAWHPGHLANLQWGWQVAVFISLLGAIAPIRFLTAERPAFALNLAGLALAAAGVLGFTTTLAVFPIAVLLILARTEWSWRRRVAFALPWLLGAAALAYALLRARGQPVPWPGLDVLAMYVLNYLGGGVLRFANKLAPWWTLLALATASMALARMGRERRALPWLALMLFAIGCAVMTALGRAGYFGADHAFVIRYVSFATLFWIGWLGLMVLAWREAAPAWRRWARPLLVVTLCFAAINGLHMLKKAMVVRERAVEYAAHIRAHYPDLDPGVLAQAYEGRAEQAPQRLGLLREWGFAPFRPEAETPREGSD